MFMSLIYSGVAWASVAVAFLSALLSRSVWKENIRVKNTVTSGKESLFIFY
jgi:hypothetical protein